MIDYHSIEPNEEAFSLSLSLLSPPPHSTLPSLRKARAVLQEVRNLNIVPLGESRESQIISLPFLPSEGR